jgi:hypothetical protein
METNILIGTLVLKAVNAFNLNQNTILNYDQPKNSLLNRLIIELFIEDAELEFLHHIVNGLVFKPDIIKFIFLKTLNIFLVKNIMRGKPIQLINEEDYFTQIGGLSTQLNINRSHNMSVNEFFDLYVGYRGFVPNEHGYMYDMSSLIPEKCIRKGYTNFDLKIQLDSSGEFLYIIEEGEKRYETDKYFYLAKARTLSAVFNIMIILDHNQSIHDKIREPINLLLNKYIKNKNNPVYRFLCFFRLDPYRKNEVGGFINLNTQILPIITNVDNLSQLVSKHKSEFNIRKFLFIKDSLLSLPRGLNKYLLSWYKIINKFAIRYFTINNIDTDSETNDFLTMLTYEYKDICLEGQTPTQNISDICTMLLFTCVLHTTCHNEIFFTNTIYNPYICSTIYKQTNSKRLESKITTLNEQLNILVAFSSTVSNSMLFTNDQFGFFFKSNPREYNLFNDFVNDLQNVDIPSTSVIHPSRVGVAD